MMLQFRSFNCSKSSCDLSSQEKLAVFVWFWRRIAYWRPDVALCLIFFFFLKIPISTNGLVQTFPMHQKGPPPIVCGIHSLVMKTSNCSTWAFPTCLWKFWPPSHLHGCQQKTTDNKSLVENFSLCVYCRCNDNGRREVPMFIYWFREADVKVFLKTHQRLWRTETKHNKE